MKIHDQHVHSHYSFDSKQEIEVYLQLAFARGLKYFILTDHLDLNFLNRGQDLKFDLEKQRIELHKLQKKYESLHLLQGIEIGYKPSELKRINEIINNHNLDLINLSLHEVDGIDFFSQEDFIQLGRERTLKIYFQKSLEMVQNFDDFDVLCHLGYAFKTAYSLDNSLRIEDYETIISQIMKTLIAKDKSLEVNTKVAESLPPSYTVYILRLYKSLGGVNLTLSSDAHCVERYGDRFDKYERIIKECGFDRLVYYVARQKLFVFI
ncbi:MAG: histidinol-phosphatase HisJ family protein [Bacilli bacterium]|jgi:histidinol-phosphatase (PHP family)